jgi:hypothetical protein
MINCEKIIVRHASQFSQPSLGVPDSENAGYADGATIGQFLKNVIDTFGVILPRWVGGHERLLP